MTRAILTRSTPRFAAVSALALACSALASCAPSVETVDADVSVAFEPAPHVGATTVRVRLASLDGEPITGVDVELEGNMNHGGMVPVFTSPKEVEPGLYEGPFEFTMGGDWFVVVRAELEGDRAIEHLVEFPAVGAPGAHGGMDHGGTDHGEMQHGDTEGGHAPSDHGADGHHQG